MRIFDLHCDTATECFDRGERLTSNSCTVSLDDACALFDRFAINFAVWSSDELSPSSAYIRAKSVIDFVKSHTSGSNAPRILLSCEPDGKIIEKSDNFIVLSLENSLPVCDNIAYISEFYSMGVRMISPTWNAENPIAGGCHQDTGFSRLGLQFIDECSRLGIVIDVSHLGRRGFDQLLDRTDLPVIASHSCAAALREHPRNLTDEQISAIARRRGIIGLNFWTELLTSSEKATKDDIYAHISHIISVGGESVPAIGTDFDGADMSEGLNTQRSLRTLFEYLLSRGFSEKLCNSIFFDNAFNYFTENL